MANDNYGRKTITTYNPDGSTRGHISLVATQGGHLMMWVTDLVKPIDAAEGTAQVTLSPDKVAELLRFLQGV